MNRVRKATRAEQREHWLKRDAFVQRREAAYVKLGMGVAKRLVMLALHTVEAAYEMGCKDGDEGLE